MSPAPVVWVTRPQPGADRTAAALAAMGYEPVILPLVEIAAEDPGLGPDDVEDTNFVAVTSANAIRHAPIPLARALKMKPVYAVGAATKMAALDRGFLRVFSADGAVDDLVALILRLEKPGAKGLYLAGRNRAGDLEGKLAAHGLQCRVAIVYSANIVSHMTDFIADALTRRRPDAILFHSARTARAFAQDAASHAPQSFEKTLFFTMSERVAAALPDGMAGRATVADAPTEQALLDALAHALPASRA